MYNFEKTAGLILDQQDDPGAGWETISQFWPDYLDYPDIGIEMNKNACLSMFSDGHEKIAKYPVDTPENALASSMYFLAHGLHAIPDSEEQVKIAADLQEYRIAHGVELPREFINFLRKEASREPEEVFADDEERLPTTTPSQTKDSISVFTKHASRWPTDERMIYGARLQKAADYHEIDVEVPYSDTSLSKYASGAIKQRVDLMKRLTSTVMEGDEVYEDYINKMAELADIAEEDLDYADVIKLAQQIEELDTEYGMDEGWGTSIMDPIDTVLEGFDDRMFPEIEKEAGYDSVDWSDLPFEDHIKEAVAENPETVIPTLPRPQKKIVEDYVNEQL